jgi:hypothetical protein
MSMVIRGIASRASVPVELSNFETTLILPSAFKARELVPVMVSHTEKTGGIAVLRRAGDLLLCDITIMDERDGQHLLDLVCQDYHSLSIAYAMPPESECGNLNGIRILPDLVITEVSLHPEGACPGAHLWLEDEDGELMGDYDDAVLAARQEYYDALPLAVENPVYPPITNNPYYAEASTLFRRTEEPEPARSRPVLRLVDDGQSWQDRLMANLAKVEVSRFNVEEILLDPEAEPSDDDVFHLKISTKDGLSDFSATRAFLCGMADQLNDALALDTGDDE